MLALAADEDFNHAIVRGVLLCLPSADFRTAQEAGLKGAADPAILVWGASEGRVLITHDLATMGVEAAKRVAQGLPMPGVFRVPRTLAIGEAIDELLLDPVQPAWRVGAQGRLPTTLTSLCGARTRGRRCDWCEVSSAARPRSGGSAGRSA